MEQKRISSNKNNSNGKEADGNLIHSQVKKIKQIEIERVRGLLIEQREMARFLHERHHSRSPLGFTSEN
ncbi:hypothetical protein Nepgr_022184 [Nepenthes gracilis]|uniref:Uncharacterized protein n=1 Tax=Nepenthes gracilis TaxID=150966 RepID=A0AAD3SYA5_NEPGR|nr:hypothetical protein Nepgr_022184 [Nepenthes gracilis]